MKTIGRLIRTVAVASTLLCAALATAALAAAPNWVLLDENEDSRFYYDQSGGTLKPKETVVQVKTRVVYTDKGKADALKIMGGAKQFEPLFESRYLHDLNCGEEKSKLLEASHLDQDGVTLKSSILSGVTEWEEIPPYARMGLVLEKVCPQPSATK